MGINILAPIIQINGLIDIFYNNNFRSIPLAPYLLVILEIGGNLRGEIIKPDTKSIFNPLWIWQENL